MRPQGGGALIDELSDFEKGQGGLSAGSVLAQDWVQSGPLEAGVRPIVQPLSVRRDRRSMVRFFPLTLLTREGVPGNPTLLVVVELNGTPLFFPVLGVTLFDDDCARTVDIPVVPPGLGGLEVLLQALALDATGRGLSTVPRMLRFL